MRRRFFVESFEGQRATLRGENATHLARVLRAQPGQLYELSDGESVWLARVERAGCEAVEFSLVEALPVEKSHLEITLLLSIVKFDRFEWSLEKAAELGVKRIVPLAAVRSERALVTAAVKRARRWEKILYEAAQQARRLRPPDLGGALRAVEAFARSEDGVRLLLSERQDAAPLRSALRTKSQQKVTLAIGPEGGWTEEEFEAARAAGFAEVSLGANILRTETAVIAALAIVDYALGESALLP